MKHIKPTGLASLLFWLACSQLALMDIYDGTISGTRAHVWLTAFAIFGSALIADLSRNIVDERGRVAGFSVVGALVLSGFVMLFLAPGVSRYASSVVLILPASRLAKITSERNAWLAVGAMELALLAILLWYDSAWGALGSGTAIGASMVFAVTFAQQSLRERAGRAALAIANAELRASRELLAESSRAAERLRISRDLHDALGHHLAALSIQLDVACRRSNGTAAEHIREAHAITRLLLSDVRDVVGTLRHEGEANAAALIRPLCRNIGDLAIHLEACESITTADGAQAAALLRCVQEIITNALKHATARNLWIELTQDPRGMTLRAWDDGRGSPELRAGTGLTGMRERFEQLGGRVETTSRPGHGFEVQAFMPAVRASA